jgi:alpha,alpha-trehalose phosphorylase
MINQANFELDPWAIRESSLDLDVLAQTESVFALSNGHLGLRGNLEEGEPVGLPGTYLNGFFERHPMPIAEAAYAHPQYSQTIVNVTDGKLIRLTVGDEVFEVRYGKLRSHERVLDFRSGTLRRTLEWESPTGAVVRIKTERIVSFVFRGAAAIRYEVEPVDNPARLVVQSDLVANQPIPEPSRDPRAAAALRAPLVAELATAHDTEVLLAHRTRDSDLHMAAAMRHIIDGPENTTKEVRADGDIGRVTVAADVDPGERLTMVKLLGYGWSSRRSSDSLRAQVESSVAEAAHTGWDGLLITQREYLDDFWDRADVEIQGDDHLQQAVRFALFQVLQSAARSEGRAIPAKGLTGSGYDGHAFWDTESYVLPVLTYTAPKSARDALRWRHDTLEFARERAAELDFTGAAFPWRTIRGEECSGYWPASTAAMHINADIADAVRRYSAATHDADFERERGLELLVETARLWVSLGSQDGAGTFSINGVTGPDEYSALADNNVYTNLMAARNLMAAAEAAERHPERASELEVSEEEIESWRDAAARVRVPFDGELKVHPQAEGFTRHKRWRFGDTGDDRYPLMLHYPYFELYRSQVVKQADLVLAMYTCGDRFTAEEKERNFAYYEPLTVRDSSLSACIQAIIAAEVGHLDLAFDYLGEAAFMDLADLEHNTRDGLHIASLAGAWLAVVAGFGGLRDYGDTLQLCPRLPDALEGLRFRLLYRDARLLVDVARDSATYSLIAGEEVEIVHHGKEARLSADEPVKLDIPAVAGGPRPQQPPGREPLRRPRAD